MSRETDAKININLKLKVGAPVIFVFFLLIYSVSATQAEL